MPLVALFITFPVTSAKSGDDFAFGVFELPPPPITRQEQVAAIQRATVHSILELAGRNLTSLKLPDGFVEAAEAGQYDEALMIWGSRVGNRTGYSRLPHISGIPTAEDIQQAVAALREKVGS